MTALGRTRPFAMFSVGLVLFCWQVLRLELLPGTLVSYIIGPATQKRVCYSAA